MCLSGKELPKAKLDHDCVLCSLALPRYLSCPFTNNRNSPAICRQVGRAAALLPGFLQGDCTPILMLHDAVKVLGTCLLWADWQTLFCSSSQCCQTSQNGVVKADCEKCKCSEQFSVPMASAMIQKGLSSASPNFVFFPGHLLIVYVSCMMLQR